MKAFPENQIDVWFSLLACGGSPSLCRECGGREGKREREGKLTQSELLGAAKIEQSKLIDAATLVQNKSTDGTQLMQSEVTDAGKVTQNELMDSVNLAQNETKRFGQSKKNKTCARFARKKEDPPSARREGHRFETLRIDEGLCARGQGDHT